MPLPADLLSPKEVARLLHVHISSVHRWLNSGKLRGYKVGTARYRISRADAEALVREVVPAPEVATRSQEQARADASMERLRKRGLIR